MARKRKNGICKLCQEEKLLCDSHIIPKFIYRKIKADQNYYRIASTIPDQNHLKSQKEFQEYLLCWDCEQRLQKYETYASNILYNFQQQFIREDNVIRVVNVKYDLFKLFQLSILWRSSITSLPVFKNGKLAPRHEKRIRSMLYNEDPGEVNDYGCLMLGTNLEGKMEIRFMLNPGVFKLDGHTHIYHTFGGFRWFFIISSHMRQINKSIFSLQQNGMLTFRLYEMKDIPDIMQLFKNFMD